MNITTINESKTITLSLSGRLDTTTAPQLENEIGIIVSDISKLIIDLSELEYLSSAGLRVILTAQKKMAKQGEMIIRNANENITEVFEITGFADILTIE